jgi:hypothetical protein
MRNRKRMSSVQVSGAVPRQSRGVDLETNIRLVSGGPDGVVVCRRVKVRSAVWSDDLLATVCSVLRRRDHLVAVPSRFHEREILVIAQDTMQVGTIRKNRWQAELTDTGEVTRLRFDNETHRFVIADLLEKSLVIGFERSPDYWRLFTSARYWYRHSPEETVDGIQAISKVSFATLPMADRGIGIAFDSGFLYRSEMTVADFLDSTSAKGERTARQSRFDRLTSRDRGRKGTLLYDTGRNDVSVCYFHRFAKSVTCGSTGPIMDHRSLTEY